MQPQTLDSTGAQGSVMLVCSRCEKLDWNDQSIVRHDLLHWTLRCAAEVMEVQSLFQCGDGLGGSKFRGFGPFGVPPTRAGHDSSQNLLLSVTV